MDDDRKYVRMISRHEVCSQCVIWYAMTDSIYAMRYEVHVTRSYCSATHGLVVSVLLCVSDFPSCPPFLYSPPGALLRDTAPISTPKGLVFIRLLLVRVSNPLRARPFRLLRSVRSDGAKKNSSVPIRIVVGRCLQVMHGIQDGWEEYYRTHMG